MLRATFLIFPDIFRRRRVVRSMAFLPCGAARRIGYHVGYHTAHTARGLRILPKEAAGSDLYPILIP